MLTIRQASKNARRVHYLVQAGWRADKAVQGFGRTHRTNQASAPIFRLVTTDLDGQKRFISSIARRLAQLGALTKGQRQAGDFGVFTSRDNLESTEARDALKQFFYALNRNEIEGVSLQEFESQTGLSLTEKTKDGAVLGLRKDLPEITTFLNRLLSLKIAMQNRVFAAFSERLDAVIDARTQAGLLDAGLETIRADKVEKEAERKVHTDAESGAETNYVKLKLSNRFMPIEFPTAWRGETIKHWFRSPKGKVYAAIDAPAHTEGDTGRLIEQFRLINPVTGTHLQPVRPVIERGTKWDKIGQGEAQKLWQAEIDTAPEFISRDVHLITGAILPIWDRLSGSTRVVRAQTDQGERFLGRVIRDGDVAETMKRLGAEMSGKKLAPQELFQHLMQGGRAKLANGWTLSRRRVAGENRIELRGPSSWREGDEIKKDGVFSERINYETRYFVPTDPAEGAKVLASLTQYRPVIDTSSADPDEMLAEARRGLGHQSPDLRGPDYLTPAARARRQQLTDMVTTFVHRLAGPHAEVRFRGRYHREAVGGELGELRCRKPKSRAATTPRTCSSSCRSPPTTSARRPRTKPTTTSKAAC